jgi:hypothetical protein
MFSLQVHNALFLKIDKRNFGSLELSKSECSFDRRGRKIGVCTASTNGQQTWNHQLVPSGIAAGFPAHRVLPF